MSKDTTTNEEVRVILAPMKFIESWRRISGLSIRAFGRVIGWSFERLRNSIVSENPRQTEFMRGVCLARRAAGQTWIQAGKQLDAEFLSKRELELFEERFKEELDKAK